MHVQIMHAIICKIPLNEKLKINLHTTNVSKPPPMPINNVFLDVSLITFLVYHIPIIVITASDNTVVKAAAFCPKYGINTIFNKLLLQRTSYSPC